MHLEKTSILLEKINNLHNNLQKEPDNISAIEKDLLKDYVKALYEALLDDKKSVKPRTVIQKVVTAPKVLVVDTKGAQPEASESIDENPIAAVPEKKEYKPPRIIELSNEIKEEIASTPPKEEDESRQEAPVNSMNEDLYLLFDEEPDSKDLSSKLSNKPIKDLTKAISINEKIFTVNELFGGNMVDFEHTIGLLNGCQGYGEAVSTILSDKAMEYGWTEEKRLKKAQKFMKTIKRRYL